MRAAKSALIVGAAIASCRLAIADTTYTISAAPVSLTGIANPSTANFSTADVREVNASGIAVGQSYAPLVSGSYGKVQDVWYYNPATGTTSAIGLMGTDPTDSTVSYNASGYTATAYTSAINGAVTSLSNTGYAIGTTQRFQSSSTTTLGLDAWIYAPGVSGATGTTTAIGLDSPTATGVSQSDYLSSTDTATGAVYGVTDSGNVLGSSSSYRGGSASGTDLFIYSAANNTTAPINAYSNVSLYYTGGTASGTRNESVSSTAVSGNTGYSLIYAIRYNGGNQIGIDDFQVLNIANGSLSGLIGYQYTAAAGASGLTYTDSTAFAGDNIVNIQGNAVGLTRSVQGTSTSNDAYYYNAADGTTFLIPLISGSTVPGDDYHVTTGDLHSNQSTLLGPSGQAAGTTQRYFGASSSVNYGQDAWTYSGGSNGTVTEIGLIDGSLTGVSHGYTGTTIPTRFTTPNAINAAGDVAGVSYRYNGSTTRVGTDTWLYTPANGTVAIGLDTAGTNPLYTSSGGTHTAVITLLSPNGTVAGDTTRLTGATSSNQDAWIYYKGTTYSDTFATGTDGTAFSLVTNLTDTLALGYYDKYSGTTVTGKYAFLWNAADINNGSDGFVDLGLNITNLVSSGEWTTDAADSLLTQTTTSGVSPFAVSADGTLYGTGTLSGQPTTTSAIYSLTPSSVPEPTSLILLATGGLLTLRRRNQPL